MSVPSLEQIIKAPADQWRALAEQADIQDIRWIEALRDRQAQAQPSKPSRRNRRRSSSAGEPRRRNRSAAAVFSAMVETLNRVNGSDDHGNE